ncbi:MAG: helix-turn-helix transcriptional regulator [Myroides sp.]
MDSNSKHILPVSLPNPNKLLMIESLDYTNPYDFQHPHRHDYFEIIFVSKGHGKQQIDFNTYQMEAGQLFMIYPGQIHLMQRDSAKGIIIQFRKNIFEFITPLKHYRLYFPNSAFNLPKETFNHLYDLAGHMQVLLQNKNLSNLATYKAYSYLQILLITLSEQYTDQQLVQGSQIITSFLSLLPHYIYSHKKVSEYCTLLNCSSEKLNSACRTTLGKSALELIHEELILEIRRLLLLGDQSLKEIAFLLNFDSQANFSGFIKSKTGLTPTELQTAILQIYN